MDADARRAAALIVAAIIHSDQGVVPQADLETYAAPFIPWIAGVTTTAVTATLTLTGDRMPLTVDSTNGLAILEFEDDKGDKVAPPAGAVATATSSDTAVLTAGAAVAGTDANGVAVIQFPLSPVSAGTSSLSVHTTAADGSPLLGPDGTTPIPDPAAVTVTVNPGAPAAEVFTVTGS